MARPTASHQHPDFCQSAAAATTEVALPADDAIDQWLGLHLQRLYGDVLDEPVPERFLHILWSLHDPAAGAPGTPP
jgi:hypothetical protein